MRQTAGAATSGRASGITAVRLVLGGRVQGVGFRPFVYRQAYRLDISGSIVNRRGTVEILAQGADGDVAEFMESLLTMAPPLARPVLVSRDTVAITDARTFVIDPSTAGVDADIHLPPDYFVCEDCLEELRDPDNRRYRYPFINCTQCGPRYTLIRRLPYDRSSTGMADFVLCADCRREYSDPLDRRFHAEPIACPACGPRLHYQDGTGHCHDTGQSLAATLATLRNGGIVAVKGVGGYHLLCDARDEAAVALLRQRKRRPDKPLAVMFPPDGRDGLDQVRKAALLDPVTTGLLRNPMRPIVLVPRAPHCPLASGIAPGLAEIGALLPYSPLHYLITGEFAGPLVATSANIGGEPVLTETGDAIARLPGIADAFVHHDRPIVRPADDPVYRVIDGKARPVRLGRGNAPLERELPVSVGRPVLAVGGHMKSTVALAWGHRIVISPHIGDLGTLRGRQVFEQVIADLQQLYGVEAETVVHDAHPGYASTQWARTSGRPLAAVFHHHAHASGVAGEFPAETGWLVFAWDGTGLGTDGTLWGGEALYGRPGDWRRLASMRHFLLPGGERAISEPWRTAVALCREAAIAWSDAPAQAGELTGILDRGLNCPLSSSVGRLFDGAAALTGLVHRSSFDGQGPMRLEAAADSQTTAAVDLNCVQEENGILRTDWMPLLPMLLDTDLPVAQRAACFHASLAHALHRQARTIRARHGDFAVGLTGGVFQNRLLTEQVVTLLKDDRFRVYLPEQIPVNDGGLCFGQIMEAAGRFKV